MQKDSFKDLGAVAHMNSACFSLHKMIGGRFKHHQLISGFPALQKERQEGSKIFLSKCPLPDSKSCPRSSSMAPHWSSSGPPSDFLTFTDTEKTALGPKYTSGQGHAGPS